MKIMNILFVLSFVLIAAACNKKEEPAPKAEEAPAPEVMSTYEEQAPTQEIPTEDMTEEAPAAEGM
jgi:PBP1b-binding outer membrane lipoprotein LpoB